MQAGRHMLPVLFVLALSTLHAGASTAPAEVQPKAASAEYLSAAGPAPAPRYSGFDCYAMVQPGSIWPVGDGTYMGTVNINLENQGITDMPAGWTITVSNPAYMGMHQAWNWECSHVDSTGTAWGQATQSWEVLQANANNQVGIGAIFRGKSPEDFIPRQITVNGQSCYIGQA